MDLDDDELWATQYSRNYVKKSVIKKHKKELEEVLLLTNDAEVAKDTMSKIEILGVLLNE